MYKLENTQVDIPAELRELVRYTDQRWQGVPSMPALFEQIAQVAQHDARCWFDHYAISDALSAREDGRGALLESVSPQSRGMAPYYDNACVWLSALSSAARLLDEASKQVDGAWDYSEQTRILCAEMRRQYPDLQAARPKGWDELAAAGTNDDDEDKLDHSTYNRLANEKDFKGADSASTLDHGFVGRTLLPRVMHEAQNHGRKAYEMLVSALYSHFLQITCHTNTQDMLAALAQLPLRDKEPNLVWDLAVSTEQPLLGALVSMAQRKLSQSTCKMPPQEALADAITRQVAFENKSKEEQAAIVAANELELDEFIGAASSMESTQEYERTQALTIAAAVAQLRQSCPGTTDAAPARARGNRMR